MKKPALILTLALLGGCTHPATHIVNTQPKVYDVPIKKTFFFQQNRETVWNNLLTLFANSEFTIDQINMNAYQVKMRLAGKPSDKYIDCGTKKVYTDGNIMTITNAKQNYTYTAYRHNHLDTYSISNSFTGFVHLLVIAEGSSVRVIPKLSMELLTEKRRTSTQGAGYTTDRQYRVQLTPYQAENAQAFGNTCRTTGFFERQTLDIIARAGITASAPVPYNDDTTW